MTDEGLAILTGFPNLRALDVSEVAATGAAVAKLPNPETSSRCTYCNRG